jgi:predicted secreted protein
MLARPEPRGDTLRITLIHAVYGAGWALVSIAAGGDVSPWPAVSILILSIVLAVATVRKLRRRTITPAPLDPKIARMVRRVNVVTAVAALLYGWAMSMAGQEARAIAAVMVVLGVHFLPMWALLRRPSLLAMGISLAVIGVLVWHAPIMAATGCFFAAMVFAGNSVRLSLR